MYHLLYTYFIHLYTILSDYRPDFEVFGFLNLFSKRFKLPEAITFDFIYACRQLTHVSFLCIVFVDRRYVFARMPPVFYILA